MRGFRFWPLLYLAFIFIFFGIFLFFDPGHFQAFTIVLIINIVFSIALSFLEGRRTFKNRKNNTEEAYTNPNSIHNENSEEIIGNAQVGSLIIESEDMDDKKNSGILRAYAIARIKPFNGSIYNKLEFFELEAGISFGRVPGFKSLPFKIEVEGTGIIPFLIVARSEEFTIENWQQPLDFDTNGSRSQLVRFYLYPIKVGPSKIFIDFYYHRHWLQTVIINNLYIGIDKQITGID